MKYFKLVYTEQKCDYSNKYLIMLHGWGCNKDIFNEYVDSLKNNYNIIAFDLYGFGQSMDPKPFFDVYEYALQIYLFLISRNIKEVNILAHSFGGRLAIILSTIFDIKTNKLVLTGSAGLKPKYSLTYYFKVYLYKIKKKFLKKCKSGGSSDYLNCNKVMQKVFVKVVNQHLDYLLNKVYSKTYLVWGDKDKDTPLYMYNNFKESLKNNKCFVVKNASHFCIFTHSYLCKNKIREFFVL